MPLRTRYRALAAQPGFEADPAQLDALAALEAVAARIAASGRFGQRRQPPQGLWLWGPVGRGKTLLMDLLVDTLPARHTQRFHFHRFMREVHRQLRALAGQPDPLDRLARRLARTTRVLCFDEFFVADIADAMILGRLMTALFRRGVFLVATSNQHPDQLYADGLQRQRFLPAIAQLQAHCRIHRLDGARDHRRRRLQGLPLFLAAGPDADAQLDAWLTRLAGTCPVRGDPLRVQGRPIPCRARGDGVAWFDFASLCEGPRSPLDYIELAERFHTLILSDIPSLGGSGAPGWVVQGTEDRPASATNRRRFLSGNDDRSRRFIALVDELYDRGVTLIASAAVGIEALYPEGPLAFPFERTRSRLLEMQSREYLERHRRTDGAAGY